MALSNAIYYIFLTYFAESFLLFPSQDPELFVDPLVAQGPYEVMEYRIELPIAADGSPSGITVFKPDAGWFFSQLPVVLWTLGVNEQAHYQQELHQTLASYGYAVIVPDSRPFTLVPDLNYHGRNVALGDQALRLAQLGLLGFFVDQDRVAVGGCGIGGSIATFVAAQDDSEIDAIVLWGPAPSPLWLGVDPDELWSDVEQPTFLLLAEYDYLSPPEGFPQDLKDELDVEAEDIEEYIIPKGTHFFFQQPSGSDGQLEENAVLLDNWTREEQLTDAITRTREYLDTTLEIPR